MTPGERYDRAIWFTVAVAIVIVLLLTHGCSASQPAPHVLDDAYSDAIWQAERDATSCNDALVRIGRVEKEWAPVWAKYGHPEPPPQLACRDGGAK